MRAPRWCLPAVTLPTLACGGIVDAPVRDTPFVYALVSPAPVTRRAVVQDSTPWALLLTGRSPIEVSYRRVERFRMRRVRDAASFVWLPRTMTGTPDARFGLQVDGGAGANVHLRETGDSGGLGWRALTGGDSYTLEVLAEGASITGSATIPAAPQPVYSDVGSAHVVRWPRAPGAAGYFVQPMDMDFPHFTVDTAFVWCESGWSGPSPSPRTLRIVALDANAYRYLSDTSVASAGLTGALGLFGGANEARLTLSGEPPPYDPECFMTRP